MHNAILDGKPVRILTGVHGDFFGRMKVDVIFYEDDLFVFGDVAEVINIANLSSDEIIQLINVPKTVVCAWCLSERSFVVIKALSGNDGYGTLRPC